VVSREEEEEKEEKEPSKVVYKGGER